MQATPTAEEFKASQRELWSTAATAWRKWWPVFEACAQPLSDRLVELAGVEAGERVLDVATGIGEPALTAARRAGIAGSVLGVDLAPMMIAIAREREREERAKQPQLAPTTFEERDAERLELPDASFDAVTCRWGVMLMRDPVAALEGMRRALVSRGRVAVAVWGAPATVPFITLTDRIAEEELGLQPLPLDAPGPMRLGRRGTLAKLLTAAGFLDVTEEYFELALEFASAEEYVDYRCELSVTLGRVLAERSEEQRERFRRRLAEGARGWRVGGGRVRFVNEVRIGGGVRA
jgi:SAM-dependent methyltransferase